MARTRAQTNSSQGTGAVAARSNQSQRTSSASQAKETAGQKRSRPTKEEGGKAQLKKPRKHDAATNSTAANSRQKTDDGKGKLQAVLSAYGVLPLQDIGLSDSSAATPETILAFVFHAMLTSARISHELAYKTVKCLVEADYHNLDTLLKSSWQERTEVLTKGGYTRYREKTATALGELAELIKDKYGTLELMVFPHAQYVC